MKKIVFITLILTTFWVAIYCQGIVDYKIDELPIMSAVELANYNYEIVSQTYDYEIVDINGKLYIVYVRDCN